MIRFPLAARLATLAALSALPLSPCPAAAEELVAGLSRNSIAITANFTGSDLLVFGAVKREEAIPPGDLGVIVTLEGPQQTVTVRRKARVAGIWMNTDSVTVKDAPTFYAVASSAPLAQLLTPEEDLANRVSIPRAIGADPIVPTDVDRGKPADFSRALIRIREKEGTYLAEDAGVDIDEDTLFRASFLMPANLREGTYRTRIFLTRNGQVMDTEETLVDVRKEGLERWLFVLSQQQPWIYGLLALGLAALAGWSASALFRYIRR